jgi:flagellar biogenesis protein FliO
MEAIQQVLTVVAVLTLLGYSLYWLRRKGLAKFSISGITGGSQQRMQSLERLPLTPQHSLHLVRVAGRTLLVAVSPGGCSVLDGNDWESSGDNRMVDR